MAFCKIPICEYKHADLRRGGNMNPGQLRRAGRVADIRVLETNTLEQALDTPTTRADLAIVGSREGDLVIQNGNEARERFACLFKIIGKSIVDEGRRSRVIRTNRKNLFETLRFINQQCLQIDEQDERSVILNEIDTSEIVLEPMLQGEPAISREEHFMRLKQAGHIRLDARIFRMLWENQRLIPECWKGTLKYHKHIFFDGTVLKNQYGRYVFTMYWDNDEGWNWTCCQLDKGRWKAKDVSAVLKVH